MFARPAWPQAASDASSHAAPTPAPPLPLQPASSSPKPFLSLAQLMHARAHALPPAPPAPRLPPWLLLHPCLVSAELVSSAVTLPPAPAALPCASASGSLLLGQMQPSDHIVPVPLCPHPAQQAWQQRWREIATLHVPKHHQYQSMRSSLQLQQKKQLAAALVREVVRAATRSFRCGRDAPLRGRRLVREVAAYWRRSEREAWESRRRAEREEAELARRQIEQAEAERQKKKLEFLLTQTELYSHFIGRKMGIIPTDIDKSKQANKATAPADAAATAAPADATADTQMTDANGASSAAAAPAAAAASSEGAVAQPAAAANDGSALLRHASTVKNELNVSAEDAARTYIRNQQAKMAEFDSQDSKTAAATDAATAAGTATGPSTADGVAPASSSPSSPRTSPSTVSAATPVPADADANASLDLLNPSTMPQQESFVQAAPSFAGTLKSYQLRGLNWLLNLYDQGINGILADEMGLGKTVQSIAFLSYLASCKNIWGPFLIVAPNSTLHQWQQEVSKFAPELKILPYWGSAKERQILRSYWMTNKAIYTKDSPFHVLITSYNAVVADEKYFHRMKFSFAILDEAQAIKNASSLRWKSLLNLKCRNRVLLTGTPIQNSMTELWALLHFIMPEFFDNHEEFAEWFSKDVEGAATEGVGLDQRQLQRLHMILKPFMLRRVKSDVENEMPPKIEVTLPCKLSETQRRIYKQLQKKIWMAHAAENATTAGGAAGKKGFLATLSAPSAFSSTETAASDSLVTLVMQFRKVCNHPELYEKKRVLSPYYFGHQLYYPATKQKGGNLGAAAATAAAANAEKASSHASAAGAAAAPVVEKKVRIPPLFLRCPSAGLTANPLSTRYPSLLHRAIRIPSREKLLNSTFNLFTAAHVHRSLHPSSDPLSSSASSPPLLLRSAFSFLTLLDLSPLELEFFHGAEPLHAWIVLLVLAHRAERSKHSGARRAHFRIDTTPWMSLQGELSLVQEQHAPAPTPSTAVPAPFARSFCLDGDGLFWRDPSNFSSCTSLLRRLRNLSRPHVVAPPSYPLWSRSLASPCTLVDVVASDYSGWEKSVLLGVDAWKWSQCSITRNRQGCTYPVSFSQSFDLLPVGLATMHRRTYTASPYTERQARARWIAARASASKPSSAAFPPLLHAPSTPLHLVARTLHASSVSSSYALPGLMSSLSPLGVPASRLVVPTVEDLIADSGKLQVLDSLLARLKSEGHRVLIFSQMTKLIDLLESFLRFRRYKFCRLDGQTALSTRRDLVKSFQTDTSIFAFLLSTRAGGLGINLTSADTVIFYDNDWNPSSDAQAMDRVHRIGQTRQVTVYRLVCSNTVEERILIRAQQKHQIQNTVYAGGFKMMGPTSSSGATGGAGGAGGGGDAGGMDIHELFSTNELKDMLENEPGMRAIAEGQEQKKALAVSHSPPAASPAPAADSATAAAPTASSLAPAVSLKHRLPESKEDRAPKRQRADATDAQ